MPELPAFVLPTPLGNNITRLGPLGAAPLIVCALARAGDLRAALKRPVVAACLALDRLGEPLRFTSR